MQFPILNLSDTHRQVLEEQITHLSEWNKANCLGNPSEIEQVHKNTVLIATIINVLDSSMG